MKRLFIVIFLALAYSIPLLAQAKNRKPQNH